MINCSILIRDEKCTCERNFRIIRVRPQRLELAFAGCGREENGGRIVSVLAAVSTHSIIPVTVNHRY